MRQPQPSPEGEWLAACSVCCRRGARLLVPEDGAGPCPGGPLAVDSVAGLRVLSVCCAGKEGAAELPSLSARETWAGQWG